MPSTGFWLQEGSRAAIKIEPSTNAYGRGVDVNVSGALYRFIPGGFSPNFQIQKKVVDEIDGVLGSKGSLSLTRSVTLPFQHYLHYQDDAGETILATAFGDATTPSVVTGSTRRYYYRIKPLINRFFSAATKGDLTDSTYNPNGMFFYPSLIPTTLTISGSSDTFVTVSGEASGFDEVIPLSTTINMASGFSASATTLTVQSTSGFDERGFLILNRTGTAEIIYYTAIDSTNFYNCVRGLMGTTAVTHANGSSVETIAFTTSNLNTATAVDSPIATFEDISFQINERGGSALSGSDVMGITSFTFTLTNNLKTDPDTGSFGRPSKPARQGFSATFSVDETTFREMVRRFHYVNNKALKAKVIMTSPTFANTTDKVAYQCILWLPNIQYMGENPSAGMFGSGLPNVTHSFSCAVVPSTIPSGFPSETTSIGVLEFVNLRTTSLLA